MKWRIELSKNLKKFVSKNQVSEENLISYAMKAIRKLQGYNENVSVKRMKGKWKSFYRVRIGKVRVLMSINLDEKRIFIDRMDLRGDVYK